MDATPGRESGGTFDFKEVEHLTAVTPLVRRDLIMRQREEDTAPPAKKTKLAEGEGKASPMQQQQQHPTVSPAKEPRKPRTGEEAKKSVRYPRLSYSQLIPDVTEFLQKQDGSEELAVVAFLQRLMEVDIVEVDKMLADTKFHYLGGEMNKFSQVVLQPLRQELQDLVSRGAEVQKGLEEARRQKDEDAKELAELDAAVQRLKEQEAKWLELEGSLASGGMKKTTAASEASQSEEEEDVVSGSQVLERAVHLLHTSPQQIKAAVSKTATQMGNLEDLLEGMQECLETAEEKQRALFDHYKKAAMAPFPDVRQPKAIVQKMTQ